MTDLNRPLLTPEQLLDGWTPARIGRRIVTLAETESTNSVALASAGDPDCDGLAVFADFQTAGRGRAGRTWLAPRGASILCSVLLCSPPAFLESAARRGERTGPLGRAYPSGASCPPLPEATEASGRLTLAAAVAVCEAIRAATDVSPAIKWPNDLRVSGRKLAGILIESRVVEAQVRAWVIGIGINCYQQAGHFPPEIRETATSLDLASSQPVNRTAVARELLKALDSMLAPSKAPSLEALHASWLAHAEPLGQRVRLRSEGREYSGRTVAVDPAGGLIVQCDDGRRQWFDPLLTTLF